jgi:hypothetical protein
MPCAQTITDTIFLNSAWLICEQPLASYYRIGTLHTDSNWYYTGDFKDYNLQGQLLFAGHYDSIGKKHGAFEVHDTEGNLIVKGNYQHGRALGRWEWFYTNGMSQIILQVDTNRQIDVSFYRDPFGVIQLQQGNGSFVWHIDGFDELITNFEVKGSYANGKPIGKWVYRELDRSGIPGRIVCEEFFNDTGAFKKAKLYGYYNSTVKTRQFKFLFEPYASTITDRVRYDQMFRRGTDSLPSNNVRNYLLNRKNTGIVLQQKEFEKAIISVLIYLEKYRYEINHWDKDVEGTISFKVGDSARPEDITVQSASVTAAERDFLIYLMSKFRNIDMPTYDKIGYEGYHNIYFYTIDIREFAPASLKKEVGRELIFTLLPKDKYYALLKANKRNIKRYLRSEFLYYH